MELGLPIGEQDGEYNSVGLVGISDIFVTQDTFSLEQSHLTECSILPLD